MFLNMEKIFQKINFFLLNGLIFLFPFFFLNTTQEYFVTNKLYFLGFGVLLLIFISTIQIVFTKKISWEKNSFDNSILLFLTTVILSTLFSSINKVQALLNPSFGLVAMISLVILYFYLSHQKGSSLSDKVGPYITKVSSLILSLTTIVFYFQPFKNINLSQNLAFLKNSTFTPIGSQLDLAILLGFFVVWGIVSFLRPHVIPSKEGIQTKISWIPLFRGMTLIINFLALFLIVYSLFARRSLGEGGFLLPPFRLSWFAALEILKNPQTAIFGIGPDNFSAIFTRVKDFAYNQSALWQVHSFNLSRSAILQILTETGLLTFGLLVFSVFKQTIKQWSNETMKQFIYLFVYLLICLFFLPPSLIVWFLFFVTLGLINYHVQVTVSTIDLSDLLPIYLGIVVISLGLVGSSGYLLGRSYASEYFFKKSINGVVANNAKVVYDSQRQAIILNPFIERFRSNFAQTNLLIANNLVQKDSKKITEQDRQIITQAIQSSIAEAKAVVSLNPQKAGNWQGLAQIYSNIINVAKGADVWTISAYQRAILADPQNPVYRVGLGGVYYSLNKYDDALRFFEQAVALKPNWPNANYNYAWAHFQKKNYPLAVNALQATLKLLDSKANKADYEKVEKELENFKKMLPKEEDQVNQLEIDNQPSSLNLPTPPTTQIDPRLELPKEASPEAK